MTVVTHRNPFGGGLISQHVFYRTINQPDIVRLVNQALMDMYPPKEHPPNQ
ncbi:hypothetical protein JW930_02805 [Candidatus Woesearchaeota archaeon]|nr:hypothetical protein [Candidatus Woesearchaeota archaeon]